MAFDGESVAVTNPRRLTMMTRYGATAALAGMLILCAAGPSLAASKGEASEQTALDATKLTLSQAIATAEQRTAGKAYEAGVDVEHGKPRVVVETNGPNGVRTIIIDAQSGEIVGEHPGSHPD
jgi:hypothetical protein